MLGFSHPMHAATRLQALDSSDFRTRTAKKNSWSFNRTLVYLVKDRILLQLSNLSVTWFSTKKKKKERKNQNILRKRNQHSLKWKWRIAVIPNWAKLPPVPDQQCTHPPHHNLQSDWRRHVYKLSGSCVLEYTTAARNQESTYSHQINTTLSKYVTYTDTT